MNVVFKILNFMIKFFGIFLWVMVLFVIVVGLLNLFKFIENCLCKGWVYVNLFFIFFVVKLWKKLLLYIKWNYFRVDGKDVCCFGFLWNEKIGLCESNNNFFKV